MGKRVFPRVLVISHTCFSSNNSMGSTLASYFLGYDSDSIAQFYIKDMVPNMETCNRYYMVTDSDVLHKVLKPWQKSIGKQVVRETDSSAESGTATLDKRATGNRALKMLCRNLIWSTGVWNNKKLDAWVREFEPDVLLCQPGDFPYLLTLTCKVAKKYHLPIIIHQSETYYLKPMQANDLAYKVYRRIYRKAYDKLMTHTSAVVYLCEQIKRDYDLYFNVPSYCIMKSTNIVPRKKALHKPGDYKFLYAGNIGQKVGRDRPLVEIGQALKELGYTLDVYTVSSGDHMKDFTIENGITLHDAVPYGVLQKIIGESDFIIHAESQNEENIIDLRYAFTTKIADMLASGCCPIVYGSTRIASIAYFKDNQLGCVIEEKENLKEQIRILIQDPKRCSSYIDKALKQAEQYHNPEKNAELMKMCIQKVCNSK